MKWKPALCVAVLALAGGCSSEQNPYASFGEYGFSYDLQQAPVPGLTVAENDRISKMASTTPTTVVVTPVVVTPDAPAAMTAPVVTPTPAMPPPNAQ